MRIALAMTAGVMFLVGIAMAEAAGGQEATPLGPSGGWVGAIAVSPNFRWDGSAWVAPFGGRIFATADHGSTWHEAHAGETDPIVTGLAVSPNYASDRTVFAAADNGVFRSGDGGNNWSNVSSGLGSHYARTVAVSPRFADDHTLYVATDAGVFRTFSAGGSWLPPLDHGVAMTTVAVVPAGLNSLLAAPSSGGLLQSADGGVTWTGVTGFPSDRHVLSLAVSADSGSGQTEVAGTDDGIWVSTDRGINWTQRARQGDRVDALALSPSFGRDSTIFAGSGSGQGVSVSRDGGMTWNAAGVMSFGFVASLALSPSFEADSVIFAGTAGRGVEISTDGGSSWKESDSGLNAAQISQIRDAAPGIVAGGDGTAQILLADGSWRSLDLPTAFLTGLDAHDRQLFVGTQDRGLQVSSDGGSHWAAADLPQSDVSAVSLSPDFEREQTVLVADGYVYRSMDAGTTWQQGQGIAANDIRRFSFSPYYAIDGTVFAATITQRVYASTDGGLTWSSASTGLPEEQINDIAFSPAFDQDRTAYAGTTGGIFISHDAGASWTALSAQPASRVITALTWSPGGALIAGTDSGVFQLAGGLWQPLANGWSNYVTALLYRRGTDADVLYVGTLGAGVWDIALPPTLTLSPTSTLTPTAAATATATPSATSAPTAPPLVHRNGRLHPYISVYPNPAEAGSPTLAIVHGPPGGTYRLVMTAQPWSRNREGRLAADGSAAVGFLAPSRPVRLTLSVRRGSQTATTELILPVLAPAGGHRPA